MIGFYNYTVVLTYFSLYISIIGIIFSITGNIDLGLICLIISGVCDMFDGKIASTRERTPEEKRFGIQIDSLSDLVCFAILPAIICYELGTKGITTYFVVPIYILAGLIRLAYFNVIEELSPSEKYGNKTFIGLPITTIAGIFPLVYCLNIGNFKFIYPFLLSLMSIAFLLPFKIKKPKSKIMYTMASILCVEFLFLLKQVIS